MATLDPTHPIPTIATRLFIAPSHANVRPSLVYNRHMPRAILRLLTAVAFLAAPASSFAQVSLRTPDLVVGLDAGRITSLRAAGGTRECLPAGQRPPLLSIRVAGRAEDPDGMSYRERTRDLTLRFSASGVEVDVRTTAHATHLAFEIAAVRPTGVVDAIVWGPYPTSIGETVGEIVGVVRDGTTAIGLQPLNLETRGGALLNDEGSDPSRGTLAQPAPWGSVLQAFARDRSRPRTVSAWNGQFPNMPVPAIPGETVVGSRVALFASPAAGALQRIGAIERAEGMPHPLLDREWVKQWRDQGRSYLIAPFSETTVDELLGYVKRANLMSLYHPEPFETWGHYRLDPAQFPGGNAGMKKAVEKAARLGIRIGVHTLTNFINTNDPYVSPVPDPRLALAGGSTLTAAIDEAVTEIAVASPEYFDNEKANWLHTARVGDELVRYTSVSKAPPWRLLGCERGAFGTRPAAHPSGTTVGKLIDHPYKVFFPNLALQDEIAANLARWFNETGVSQLDFDGREGCLASGQGDYAQDRFAKVFFDRLDHGVVNGTSTSSPFYWHINSYCNWGEPWYGGFRESMQEYRIQNQALFSRNYVPNMLGWYRLTATTSLAEMEWMLARAAGFGAGFAMSTTLEELRQNPDSGLLLDTIREWESARRAGAFGAAQRERLQDASLEFHLEPAAGANGWRLFPYHAGPAFAHERVVRQPGEPTGAEWRVENHDAAQPVRFRLQVTGDSGSISRLRFEVDRRTLEVAAEVKAGESLVFAGDGDARVYDAKGRQTRTATVTRPVPWLPAGASTVGFDCVFSGEPKVTVTFPTRGEAEVVAPARREP